MSAAVDMRRKNSEDKSAAGKKRRKAKVAALKKSRPPRSPSAAQAAAAGIPDGWGWRGVLVGVVLLGVCVGLGVQVASQSQQMRALYSQLQKDQLTQDELLAERSRLLLERGALNNYSAAETIAREQLDMRFPESITQVEVEADGAPRQQLIGTRRQR